MGRRKKIAAPQIYLLEHEHLNSTRIRLLQAAGALRTEHPERGCMSRSRRQIFGLENRHLNFRFGSGRVPRWLDMPDIEDGADQ
jgi:hypothetical protein